jgi:hypothetical protein
MAAENAVSIPGESGLFGALSSTVTLLFLPLEFNHSDVTNIIHISHLQTTCTQP